MRVAPFHAAGESELHEGLLVYHDDAECSAGRLVLADGADLPGTAGRRRCLRCELLAAGEGARPPIEVHVAPADPWADAL